MKLVERLYPFRFTIFLISLLFILFGSLIVPLELFDVYITPIFFIVNILAGILLISKKKKLHNFFISLFILSIVVILFSSYLFEDEEGYRYIEFAILFSFYCFVTYEIIAQVWQSTDVNRGVILGLMSGYICLGLVGFFICLAIELAEPGSFTGLSALELNPAAKRDSLAYYSFVTLLTIGYGEITPVSKLARNASVLIGLMGQFYLVIVTAVVIEKYIRHSKRPD
ncbi:potassium channel family protein [uncultured Eudoraea sp.]|uniref:potassium channel family protein n=1 Tax=uncultured Eudoraea sp. TaxID=1035614 RepID=UPI0026273C5A|nr:potassium channel family protein [uncultured Eudoraea sp.]